MADTIEGMKTRRIAFALSLAVLLGIALAIPYRPVIAEGAPAPHRPYARLAPVSGLRLHVFNTGMNRMSELLVGANPPERPAPAFVVEHPRHGLVVFDTGLSLDVARRGEAAYPMPMRWLMTSRSRPERVLDAQMREAGLDPERVTLVVISHEHDDHLGRLTAFPRARVLSNAEVPRAEPIRFDSRLAPFERAHDLFGDGSLVLVAAEGHTAHDVMLRVALPSGPVLLAGDAVVHRDWLRSQDVQRIADDAERAASVRNRIRALLVDDPSLVLVPGHDLRELPVGRVDFVLHHPECFEAGPCWGGAPD